MVKYMRLYKQARKCNKFLKRVATCNDCKVVMTAINESENGVRITCQRSSKKSRSPFNTILQVYIKLVCHHRYMVSLRCDSIMRPERMVWLIRFWPDQVRYFVKDVTVHIKSFLHTANGNYNNYLPSRPLASEI